MNKIIENLNPQQKQAVEATDGAMLIIAGPGSGKTRCLTHKVAYLIESEKADPEEILAVTFTNKAANEMKERVEKLLRLQEQPQEKPPPTGRERLGNAAAGDPWIGTFHSICARILRIDGKEIGIPQNYVIYDTYDSQKVIKNVVKDLRLPEKELRPGSVLGTISSAKNELVTAEDYKNYAHGYYQEQVAKIYPQYQKILGQNNALDFGDLILKTVQLLQTKSEIRQKWQNRFKYFLVDEYQDTNHAQYVFIQTLAQKTGNLCVVGDVSQAIYSWRGANFKNILNFERDWPDAKTFHLEKNYRSTKKIIDAAKNVIENNRTHINLNLHTENQTGRSIRIFEAWDEKDEAMYIARRVLLLPKSKKCGVFYRTNAQSRILEETLVRQGIPYQLVGGTKFYERREIKDILSYLRLIANPQDTLSLKRIINVPPRRVGEVTQKELAKRNWKLEKADEYFEFSLSRLIHERDHLPPAEIMAIILEKTGYLKWLNERSEENEGRIENIKELHAVASQFEDLKDFLENVTLVENTQSSKGQGNLYLPTRGKRNAASSLPSVVLMTLHAAKGLEFPTVFITGLEEGLLPHSRSMLDNHQLEEERRLFYVGMTRAKKDLHLTYAQKRLFFGGQRAGEPSRFLHEIPDNLKKEI